jgi:hypothetical protein
MEPAVGGSVEPYHIVSGVNARMRGELSVAGSGPFLRTL